MLLDIEYDLVRYQHKVVCGEDRQSDIIVSIKKSLQPDVGATWKDDEIINTGLSIDDCTKIHEAWGEKKEVTEKEIQKLLEDLSDFDWCGVEDEPYIQEHLITWLSRLGIKVRFKNTEGNK